MTPTVRTSAPRRSLRRLLRDWAADCRGIAATEFAFIVPLMLVLFFGTVEFCSAIAINRKVSLTARTLSDLTSQSTSINSSDVAAFFLVASKIIWPYPMAQPNPFFASPVSGTITELYVDPTTHKARVQWSTGTAPLTAGNIVSTVPSALLVDGSYLIYSQVSYTYTPTVGWVMAKGGITLSDIAFTRPRQSSCVLFSGIDTTNCPQR
ncbi:TadE/TadG family type IV pilus assembly protein [Bradyrhizobium sp. STM 3557]|uniref:TadE/TadG family type IV pilus assembly protein n=1 Tax=Bradyrhizobium sp. STM 3557 TaxID=578920 RepID=UPI00388D0411